MKEHCYVKLSAEVSREPFEAVKNSDYTIYESHVEFKRLSGKVDKAVLNIKEIPLNGVKAGDKVSLDGTLRTYKLADGKSNTVILVYNITKDDGGDYVNNVDIVGRIVSTRLTKNSGGTAVCEARVEVKCGYNKMSRMTVVGWGVTATKLSELKEGARVKIIGRLQSRHMAEKDDDSEALEIAIKSLEVVGEDNESEV